MENPETNLKKPSSRTNISVWRVDLLPILCEIFLHQLSLFWQFRKNHFFSLRFLVIFSIKIQKTSFQMTILDIKIQSLRGGIVIDHLS